LQHAFQTVGRPRKSAKCDIHDRWNVAGALHKPKGMTRNWYSPNGRLQTVGLLNWDLPIATRKVECGKPTSAGECFQCIIDTQQRVSVFGGHVVEPTEINTEPRKAIFLAHDDDERRPRAVCRFDDVSVEHIGDHSLHVRALGWRQTSRWYFHMSRIPRVNAVGCKLRMANIFVRCCDTTTIFPKNGSQCVPAVCIQFFHRWQHLVDNAAVVVIGCAGRRYDLVHVPYAVGLRQWRCSSGFGDKLLNKSSLIRVTAAPVSSRSWESVPATLVCTKIDDGLVKATTCTASCWERPVRGVGNCLDWGPLGTLPMLRAGRFPGDEVGSVAVRSGTGVICGFGRRSCSSSRSAIGTSMLLVWRHNGASNFLR
ncbi:hypothetical protein T4D_11393, partial [Trichinella pseudospiralis]